MQGIMNKNTLQYSYGSNRTMLTSHTYFALLNTPIMRHPSIVSQFSFVRAFGFILPSLA